MDVVVPALKKMGGLVVEEVQWKQVNVQIRKNYKCKRKDQFYSEEKLFKALIFTIFLNASEKMTVHNVIDL